LSDFLDDYSDTFALVQYHVSDDYTYPWGWTRWYYYNPVYIPSTVHGGVLLRVGNQGYTGYRSLYDQRRAVPTDVTIELSGEHLTGQTYRVSAEVAIEPGDGEPRTMRIYMVQVLDYWPAYGGYHRNGFKQEATTEDVTLSPGESEVVERDFTFDADSWNDQENITIVAWAQQTGPYPSNSEVYQAGIMNWPFECIGDLNGDGKTNQQDIGIFIADWGCYDPENGCVGDLNGDDRTDQQDLGIFIANFGCDSTR
jgi:hypothetical protein